MRIMFYIEQLFENLVNIRKNLKLSVILVVKMTSVFFALFLMNLVILVYILWIITAITPMV